MTPRKPRLLPVVRRARAELDVLEAIDHYLLESPALALAFVDALELACSQIQRHPGIGSPRYAEALNLPGLRMWRCKGFPHLVFYVQRPDCIDIWRVLHERRDLPPHLQPDDATD